MIETTYENLRYFILGAVSVIVTVILLKLGELLRERRESAEKSVKEMQRRLHFLEEKIIKDICEKR